MRFLIFSLHCACPSVIILFYIGLFLYHFTFIFYNKNKARFQHMHRCAYIVWYIVPFIDFFINVDNFIIFNFFFHKKYFLTFSFFFLWILSEAILSSVSTLFYLSKSVLIIINFVHNRIWNRSGNGSLKYIYKNI